MLDDITDRERLLYEEIRNQKAHVHILVGVVVFLLFELFIECGSLIPTVRELNKRGWHNKTWTSRAGKTIGGRPFDNPSFNRRACCSPVGYVEAEEREC